MILVDNNQVIIASLFQSLKFAEPGTNFCDLLRHMTLNTYRSIRNKYHPKFGDIVLCNDSPNVWRRDFFPNYKKNRKKTSLGGPIEWNEIYDILETLRHEFKENLPYRNISVPKCEADDIIAVLAHALPIQEQVMIISSDKDFQQLQTRPNIHQWSLNTKKDMICKAPENFLVEHIIRGDSSDGIPNIFSADDVFVVDEKRQSVCTANRLERVKQQMEAKTDLDTPEETNNLKRNRTLIDFRSIPSDIVMGILESYASTECAPRSRLFPYFMNKGLNNLMPNLQDF